MIMSKKVDKKLTIEMMICDTNNFECLIYVEKYLIEGFYL